MSAWLGGLGCGLYLGIVGTLLVMARVEKKRIREAREFHQRRIEFWTRLFERQLAARTPEQDAVEELLVSL